MRLSDQEAGGVRAPSYLKSRLSALMAHPDCVYIDHGWKLEVWRESQAPIANQLSASTERPGPSQGRRRSTSPNWEKELADAVQGIPDEVRVRWRRQLGLSEEEELP